MGGWASSVRPFSAPAGTIRIDEKNGVGVGGVGGARDCQPGLVGVFPLARIFTTYRRDEAHDHAR